VYVQILIGATMRHTGAGLAIPDFPLAFGRLVPAAWSGPIAIHYAHRVGALVIAALIIALTSHVFYHHARRRGLWRPSALLLVLLAIQITLGAFTVLSGKQYIINSLHVVGGAMVLATSLVLTLRAHHSAGFGSAGSKEQDPAYGDKIPIADVRRAGPALRTRQTGARA
jgi:cytochrome c oxidase assembly protein subunit 15